MKRFLLAILMLIASTFALADAVFREGSDVVHLRNAACTDEKVLVLARAVDPDADDLRAASAIVGGKVFGACWHLHNGTVHVLYEDGDQGLIPPQLLREDAGV